MSATPLATVSIAEAARAYRAGDLSPVEVTQACLQRIGDFDGELNAFATVTSDHALAQARAAEQTLLDDPGAHHPLLGIPLGVKDMVDTAGIPTSAGSAALAGRVPVEDATVWRRLDAAGAVLIGKTRTHELAYGVATPPARNPWDLTRMPGGSSGGSAAALAAGMCLGAVGTDTAGSVRIPAGLCGVVGLKPTRGLCPTDGVIPLSPTLDHVGPMARTAEDARLLLAAMAGMIDPPSDGAGSDGADAGAVLHLPAAMTAQIVDLDGARVGVACTDALMSPLVRAALARIGDAFDRAGSAVEEIAVPSYRDAVRCADQIITVEAAVLNAELLVSAADRLRPDTRRKLESATRFDGVTYYRALRHLEKVRHGFEQALEQFDLLLAPGVACQAPEYGAESVSIDGEEHPLGRALCSNTAAFNLAGLPALALPAGAPEGLPVGVQLVGRAGSDAWLLSLASALIEEHDKSMPEAAA